MKAIRGIFVRIDDEAEERELMLAFQEMGYEWTGEGILEFLRDEIFGEDGEEGESEASRGKEFGQTIVEALRKNPRAPSVAAELLAGAFVGAKAALMEKIKTAKGGGKHA